MRLPASNRQMKVFLLSHSSRSPGWVQFFSMSRAQVFADGSAAFSSGTHRGDLE